MSWLRLDALTFQDRNVRRAGRAGRLTFMAAITMTKAHTWQSPTEERGFLPAKDFTAEEIAVWFGEVSDDAVKFYELGIQACLTEGLLARCAGGFSVPNWARYQPDPTNAVRQARFRERDADARRNGDNRDKPTKPRRKSGKVNGVTPRYVSNEDVTGRDVTKSTSTSPSTPQPSPLRPPVGSAAGAATAGSPSPVGNGHAAPRMLSPEENRDRLAQLREEILRKNRAPVDSQSFEDRRRAALAALTTEVPTCTSDAPETPATTPPTSSSSRPNSEDPTPSDSDSKTAPDPAAGSDH